MTVTLDHEATGMRTKSICGDHGRGQRWNESALLKWRTCQFLLGELQTVLAKPQVAGNQVTSCMMQTARAHPTQPPEGAFQKRRQVTPGPRVEGGAHSLARRASAPSVLVSLCCNISGPLRDHFLTEVFCDPVIEKTPPLG